MSGIPKATTLPEKEDYREDFTEFFKDPSKAPEANGVTWHSVRLMNNEMKRNKVPMSKAHYDTATESIKEGKPICEYMQDENKHVLDSSGSGVVYKAGFQVHKGIDWLKGE